MAKITETAQPKVTRVKGLQTVEIGGVPKLVEEVVYVDWGPKLGVSKSYIMARENDAPKADLDGLDAILRRRGLQIDREASSIACFAKTGKKLLIG